MPETCFKIDSTVSLCFQKYSVHSAQKRALLKVYVFRYFTRKKGQNDEAEMLTARNRLKFFLASDHVSSPNWMSQNFCFSSLLLLVLSFLWAVSQNSHLSQHWVLLDFFYLSCKWFLLSSDFLQTRLSSVYSFFLFCWFLVLLFSLSCGPLRQLFMLCRWYEELFRLQDRWTLAAESGRWVLDKATDFIGKGGWTCLK